MMLFIATMRRQYFLVLFASQPKILKSWNKAWFRWSWINHNPSNCGDPAPPQVFIAPALGGGAAAWRRALEYPHFCCLQTNWPKDKVANPTEFPNTKSPPPKRKQPILVNTKKKQKFEQLFTKSKTVLKKLLSFCILGTFGSIKINWFWSLGTGILSFVFTFLVFSDKISACARHFIWA